MRRAKSEEQWKRRRKGWYFVDFVLPDLPEVPDLTIRKFLHGSARACPPTLSTAHPAFVIRQWQTLTRSLCRRRRRIALLLTCFLSADT